MNDATSSPNRPANTSDYYRIKSLYFNKLQAFNYIESLGNLINSLALNRLRKTYQISPGEFIYLTSAYQLSKTKAYNSFTINQLKSLLIISLRNAQKYNRILLKNGHIEHIPGVRWKYRLTDTAKNMFKAYISHYNKEITRISDKYPEMFK